MKAVIIVFPGTNREKDMHHALTLAGFDASYVFCSETDLPDGTDLVALAGGFSYGDYLRTGAMSARTPITDAIKHYADKGGKILGVCNGFQILCEMGLLDGVLMRNKNGRFLCTTLDIKVANNNTVFTSDYKKDEIIHIPIAHGEGNYYADENTLKVLEENNRIVFRYQDNPNGSLGDIAGIMNAQGNVLGMMPHPENHVDALQKNQDGLRLFSSIVQGLLG